jgi:predicted DNA binding CopG/RHH family protein
VPFTIYALVDPRTDQVRYVGCTAQPLGQRAKAHLTERGNARKYQWVQELRQANLEPEVQLLEEAEDEPAEREQYWIALKQAEGCELFNGWVSSPRYWTRPHTSIFKQINRLDEPQLSEPVDTEMTDVETAAIEALVATTEADLQAAPQPTTIRWSAEQLAVVRCAAARYGMPYQTYVKDAAFRRALEDLRQIDGLKR